MQCLWRDARVQCLAQGNLDSAKSELLQNNIYGHLDLLKNENNTWLSCHRHRARCSNTYHIGSIKKLSNLVINMLDYSTLRLNRYQTLPFYVRLGFNIEIREDCTVPHSSHAFFSNIAHLQHQISPSLVPLAVI